jgi:hypothetical protein
MLDSSYSNSTRNCGSVSCEMFSAKENPKVNKIVVIVDRIAKQKAKQIYNILE